MLVLTLPYECIICHRTFKDNFQLVYNEKYFDTIETLNDNGKPITYFELKDIDYLHPIKNERKCRKCSKHVPLTEFGLKV